MKSLLGKAQDPAFWATVRQSETYRAWREELLLKWEKEAKQDIPRLNYSAYRRFTQDGDRDTYEKPYFQRRRAVGTTAVLSLIYPENEEYMTQLMDIIYAICDEYTWCLPAHQTELGVNNNSHIDLFAAETGFCLSEIYTMLGDRLDPLIADRIRVEIDRRIIQSFRNKHFHWETVHTNWAAVCAGSVGCTFMLMRPDLHAELEGRFCAAMDSFLEGFGPDGICEEGFHYWCYGFGFFSVWADMIRTFTDGQVDYFKLDVVRAVAPFLSRMYLTGSCIVSFSDTARAGHYNMGLLHYLKNEYPGEVILPDPEYAELMDGCGRFCTFLRNFIWREEKYAVLNTQAPDTMVYYAPSTAWLIKRGGAYSFAAKGGHNFEPHNHNDIGSFILAKNGRQLLSDPGRGVYSRQYFSDSRYTFLSCGSNGHSVPYFGSDEDRAQRGFFYGYQKYGEDYCARDVVFTDDTFTMDIAPAYGESAVRSVIRSFTLGEKSMILHDTFDVDADVPITERFVALCPFEIGLGIARADALQIHFDPLICDVELSSGDLHPGCPIYFLDLHLKPGVTETEIVFIADESEIDHAQKY